MGCYLATPKIDKESADGGGTSESSPIKYGVAAMQGWRQSMEDAYIAFHEEERGLYQIYGVFDGHGGAAVSSWISSNFIPVFMSKLGERVWIDGLGMRAVRSGAIKESTALLSETLEDTFLELDEIMQTAEIVKQLEILDAEAKKRMEADIAIKGDFLREIVIHRNTNSNMWQTSCCQENIGGNSSASRSGINLLDDDQLDSFEEEGNDTPQDNEEIASGQTNDIAKEEERSSSSNTEEEATASSSAFDNGGAADAAAPLFENGGKIEAFAEEAAGEDTAAHKSEDAAFDKDTTAHTSESEERNGLNEAEDSEEDSHTEELYDGPLKDVIAASLEENDETDYSLDVDLEVDSENYEVDEMFAKTLWKNPDESEGEAEGKGVGKNAHPIPEVCGTTAVVALITTDKNPTIIIANAGDSRAVLSRDGVAIPMSQDHKPELPEELQRIVNAGGLVTGGRIDGNLNLSRALGDLYYKKNTELAVDCQRISPVPNIRTTRLCKKDEFLVLACDGIWDCMTNQQVVDFIHERMKMGGEYSKISRICEDICDACLARDIHAGIGVGFDNMTCLIISFSSAVRENLPEDCSISLY